MPCQTTSGLPMFGCCGEPPRNPPLSQTHAASAKMYGFLGFIGPDELYRLLTVTANRTSDWTGTPTELSSEASGSWSYRCDRNSGEKILLSQSGTLSEPTYASYAYVDSQTQWRGTNYVNVQVSGNPDYRNVDGTYGTNGTGYIQLTTMVSWIVSEPILNSLPTPSAVAAQMLAQVFSATRYNVLEGIPPQIASRRWDAENGVWNDGPIDETVFSNPIYPVAAKGRPAYLWMSDQPYVGHGSYPAISGPSIAFAEIHYARTKVWWRGAIGNEYSGFAGGVSVPWVCQGTFLNESENWLNGVIMQLTMAVEFDEAWSGIQYLVGWDLPYFGHPYCNFAP